MKMQSIKRYDAYKDSGVEWLGEVPVHWEVKRVKELGNLVLGKMLDNVESENTFYRSYLKSKNIGWLKVEDANIEKMYFSLADMRNYRLKKNDILLSEGGEVGKTSFWNDEIEECYIQNSVHKITIYKNNSPRFFLYQSYLLGSIKYYDSIVSYVSIKHLTKEKLSRVNWVKPPFAEQTAIAAYLDTKTAHIDRQIDLLSQKAAQYGKLKQSLINETVTRGLDKTVPMKDSGVEWIGKVPAHWEVKRFKEIFNKTHSGWTPDTSKRESFEGSNIWVTIRDMDNSHIHNSLNKLSDQAISEARIAITPKGSLLFSFKLSIGKIAFAGCDLYTNEAIISIENERNVNLNYYYYTLPIFLILNAKENIYGAKLLNQGIIFNTSLLYPPKSEQQAIASYLDEKTAHINRIVVTINTQIDKLKELRKTLINDVVTGKIRVA